MTRAYDIAVALHPTGKPLPNRDGWVTCCPIHGDTTPSMSIWDDGEGGINVHCQVCGKDKFAEIKDAIRSMGLLPEWEPGERAPVVKKPKPKPEPPEPTKHHFIWAYASDKPDDLEKIKKYLANRNITLDPIPQCLRWSYYKKADEYMVVAATETRDDEVVHGVQRIIIDTEDYTKLGKPKMLGAYDGACTGRGAWTDRTGNVTEIVIGEGVETVLSAHQATGKNSVAAMSAIGVTNFIIPEETETIYILVDVDTMKEKISASMTGQRVSYAKAKEFEESRPGRKAFLVTPNDTCFTDNPTKQDFNDLLMDDPTGESIKARFELAAQVDAVDWQPPVQDEEETEEAADDGYYTPAALEAMEKINKGYAMVNLGGTLRIAKEGYDESAKKHTLDFMQKGHFFDWFANIKIPVRKSNGEIKIKKVGYEWVDWLGRRQYESVVFDPSQTCDATAYNLFRGFALKPKQGDWSLMREHILSVICDGNEEHDKYVMAWLARAIQEPGGDRPGVALVLKSGKGAGKGLFAQYFGAIFGEAYLPIADQNSFTGRFNMHLSKAVVIFLDEAVWGGDKRAEGKLKQLITEPEIMFEPKGIDSISMKNFLNIIIASNEDWVVPATGDERRFCVLKPSMKQKHNKPYWQALVKEMRNGGPEAMMYDMLEHDFSDVYLRTAPMTEGLAEQVQISLPPALEFWYSVLDRGYILSDEYTGGPKGTTLVAADTDGNGDIMWPLTVLKHEVYREFTNWCRIKNVRHIEADKAFWKKTRTIWPEGTLNEGRIQRYAGRERVVHLPDLESVKASFTKATNIRLVEPEVIEDEPEPFNGQF